ncbi:MAG: hypothetical protein AB7C91_07785 [Sphaerochaeta sp.]|uniref:hypothetical protein n=1 Tax=Sphaerochaeta sp. TaxID=1972642 RepID=UPI002FC9AB9B
MRRGAHIRWLCAMLLLAPVLLSLTGCGVYSKVPPINPDNQQWEGPLLDQADMEHVQVIVQPQQTSIVLNLKDLDADLSVLFNYLGTDSPEQVGSYTFTTKTKGDYVLVIQKTE